MKSKKRFTSMVVMLAISILLLILAAVGPQLWSQYRGRTVLADGVVHDLVRDDKGLVAPIVRFNDPTGAAHFYQSQVFSSVSTYRIGQPVAVRYNPADPDFNASLASGSDPWFSRIFFGSFGLILLVISGAFLWQNMTTRKRKDQLMRQGQRIEADIVGVEPSGWELNGRRALHITAQWVNPMDKKLYIFKSQNFWFDPTPLLPASKKVGVFIDPANPKKHYMDISFLPEEA
ncbi:MAG: DUF3592 domain-containing protein [Parcubacteria group bacterium]|nr:DUF3592 domain-containing protein [Parcubacteria group bacterium]